MKIELPPLEAAVAKLIAARRGITPMKLVHDLLQEEAAIELTLWRAKEESVPQLEPPQEE